MQLMTDWLESISKKVGLKISVNMTKMQKIGDPEDDVLFLEEAHWKQLKTLQNRILWTLKKTRKEESPKSVQFQATSNCLSMNPKWLV